MGQPCRFRDGQAVAPVVQCPMDSIEVKRRAKELGADLVGIAAAAVNVWIGISLFTVVAIMWLVPDKRMERFVAENSVRE